MVIAGLSMAAPRAAGATRVYNGTLNIGHLNRIESLNPFRGIANEAYLLYFLLYDPLFAVDQDQHFVPDLATSATPNADATQWTYTIRQGVKWSDGTPLTPADVAFTINYNTMNPGQLWANQPYVNQIIPCSGSATKCGGQVTGPNQVTVYFARPFAPGWAMNFPIIQQAQWSSVTPHSAQYSYDNNNPIGTGPFIADSGIGAAQLNDQPLVLHRNPNYWAGAPSIPTLILTHFTGETTMISALDAGQIDVAMLSSAGFAAVQTQNNPNIAGQEGLQVIQMWIEVGITQLNTKTVDNKLNPARFDVNVRQAMAMATNKSFILKTFYNGKGWEGSTLVSPVTPFWHYEPTTDQFPFSLQEANALLNASGFDKFGPDGIRYASSDIYIPDIGNGVSVTIPAGTRLNFSMVTRSTHPEEGQIASYLAQSWKQIGIEIDVVPEDEIAMNTDVYAGAFDTYIWWWSGIPDPNYILSIQSNQTLKGWSDNFFDNTTYNTLYLQQLAAVNVTQRQQYVFQAQQVHYTAAPYLILVYPDYEYAYWTDFWVGWGDMNAHPGRQIGAFFGMHPLFRDLRPAGSPQVVVQGAAGRPGQPVTIQAQINDTKAGRWYLQFGDGAATTGTYAAGATTISETHDYQLPSGATSANFTVSLSVDNAAYNITNTNTVVIASVGQLPPTITSFVADASQISPGGNVTFTATARDAQSGTLTFTVDYGDGSTPGTANIAATADTNETVVFRHVYTKAGSFPASLTVSGGSGVAPATAGPLTISVVSSTRAGPSGGLPGWAVPAGAAIIVIGVAVAALQIWRRRKKESEEEKVDLPVKKQPPGSGP